MKFRNFAGSEEITRQSTARYEFFSLEYELEDGSTVVPWMEVRPVGEVNRPYINAVLAQQARNRRRLTKGKIDARMLEENREQDRDLYPRFVLTGSWGGWVDDETGEEVAYSESVASELLAQLPIEEFDDMRAFCNELHNFRS